MKTDLKKTIQTYTAPHGRFEVVTVQRAQFLMIDGRGDPNTSASYHEALATIYPVAYAVKFLSKKELDRDYTVMPLEALWWSDDMGSFTVSRDKSRWEWTMMMMVPEWIAGAHVDAARQGVERKGVAPALAALRFEAREEGRAVQTLHVGSYDDEGPVIAAMHHEFMPAHSLRAEGKHHEVYLSDSRRTAPDKLKTILRQPVVRT